MSTDDRLSVIVRYAPGTALDDAGDAVLEAGWVAAGLPTAEAYEEPFSRYQAWPDQRFRGADTSDYDSAAAWAQLVSSDADVVSVELTWYWDAGDDGPTERTYTDGALASTRESVMVDSRLSDVQHRVHQARGAYGRLLTALAADVPVHSQLATDLATLLDTFALAADLIEDAH